MKKVQHGKANVSSINYSFVAGVKQLVPMGTADMSKDQFFKILSNMGAFGAAFGAQVGVEVSHEVSHE